MAEKNTGPITLEVKVDASSANEALRDLEGGVDRLQGKIDALLASLENVKLKSDN